MNISVGQLRKPDGNMTENDGDTAEVLGEFFKSVFVEEDDKSIPEFDPRVENREAIYDINFTLDDVTNRLKSLKVDKSPGPDNLYPLVLKECHEQLALPLFIIFRKSLDEGSLPEDWKIANVTPIFKKGPRSEPGNYRPVSLTSQVCKIMESLIRGNLLRHVENFNLQTEHQHGFTRNKSCLSNLLETLEAWTEALDHGYGVDAVYLDYMKAFDRVPHKRLMEKLHGYGIHGKAHTWISDFLTKGKQRVVVKDATSEWIEVSSGVPQGSVLGPILFLLYVNELPEIVTSGIKMFADDTKMFQVIRSQDDADVLQNNLDSLSEWSDKWLLRFNTSKCKVMHIGYRSSDREYNMLKPDGSGERAVLDISEAEKDVGVWISRDLKPSTQCSKSVTKATNVLRSIRRAFRYWDKPSFTMLYKTYVRPHLEYCVQAWSPYFIKDMKLIESVQRRATRLVPSLKHFPYEERLKALDLYSMESRRLRGVIIETFKILKGFTKVDYTQFFTLAETSRTRGHPLKLLKPRARLGVRQHFFSHRVVDPWNRLSEKCVAAKTVLDFKIELDKQWKRDGHGYSIGYA